LKILLLGANGQLGQTFITQGGLAARGELVAASRDGTLIADSGMPGIAADLSAPDSLIAILEAHQPQIIVNAAAYTAVDRSEQEEALATRINGAAPGVLGQWAARNDALVVHYSTDYVFSGGASVPYKETDPVGPAGAYGRSKLAGEVALRESGAAHFIFRTAWVFSPVGHNFLRTMLRLGATHEELRVVSDQVGSPTDTVLIVRGSLAAIDKWAASSAGERNALHGTFHLTARGATTWHGFAEALLARGTDMGLIGRMPRVAAISTAEFPTPASRPAYSVLDTDRFERTFELDLPEWTSGMDRTLKTLRDLTE